ncbi:FIVAR domain-containing protein [Mycoplasmoides gallisepticum]|uniref:FIVAR domain-containing protein n=1 Tax=Mycoplasmoides gallisepticum TaxID=2096 RepID=UPI0013054262|nr:FIVAR domain-containing protein [Mycoplasmoides gallisepticum]
MNEAKAALTSLIRTKNDNEQLYTDYAKIQVKLTSAYTTAQTVLDNSGSTLQNIKDAQRDLENAISDAKSSKQTFNTTNADLVTAYQELKTALGREADTLAKFSQSGIQYILARARLNSLYKSGKEIVSKTLEPVKGEIPTTQSITRITTELKAFSAASVAKDVIGVIKKLLPSKS